MDREEMLKVAIQCGADNEYANGQFLTEAQYRFAAAMYAKGAEDMRERAACVAEIHEEWPGGAEAIRALPITTDKENKDD